MSLQLYSQLVKESEAPELFHLWSFLTVIGSAMGRRNYLQIGNLQPYFPNLYVILTGGPSTKKSTCLSMANRYVKEAGLDIHFAPKDTAGQRQGVISGMNLLDDVGRAVAQDELKDSDLYDEEIFDTLAKTPMDLIESPKKTDYSIKDHPKYDDLVTLFKKTHPDDRNCLLVSASELPSFLGQNSTSLTVFLTEMWDGSNNYEYRLKNEVAFINKPLLSILGATQPAMIPSMLPASVEGQGFLSRIIFVYGAKTGIKIPIPKLPDEKLKQEFLDSIKHIPKLQGDFSFSKDGEEYYKEYYIKSDMEFVKNDARFSSYNDRRITHSLKVALILAGIEANKYNKKILPHHIQQADALLTLTEEGMPNALADFGITPDSRAREEIRLFMSSTLRPYTIKELFAIFRKTGLTQGRLSMVIQNLIDDGIIVQLNDHPIVNPITGKVTRETVLYTKQTKEEQKKREKNTKKTISKRIAEMLDDI